MKNSADVIMVPDETCRSHDNHEDGVEIPIDRLDRETLRNVIGEFVTREWEELGDAGRYTLDDKIDQVLQQLKTNRAKLVFDQIAKTCNIIPKNK